MLSHSHPRARQCFGLGLQSHHTVGQKALMRICSPRFTHFFPGSSASLFHSTICPHKTTDMPIFPPQMYFSVLIDAIFTSHHLSSSEDTHQHHCSTPNFYKILKLLCFPADHYVPLQPRDPQGQKGRDRVVWHIQQRKHRVNGVLLHSPS